MTETILILSMLVVFLVGMYWRNIGRYLLGTMKICHDNSRQHCSCSCSAPEKKIEEGYPVRDGKKIPEGFQILGKMGYYLASNDEEDLKTFTATPLQDTDPKDLA